MHQSFVFVLHANVLARKFTHDYFYDFNTLVGNAIAEDATEGKKDGGKVGKAKHFGLLRNNSALDVCASESSPLSGLGVNLPQAEPAIAMQANVPANTKPPRTGVVYSMLRNNADLKKSTTTAAPGANKSSKLSSTLKKTGSVIVSAAKKVVKQLPTSKSRKTRNSDFLSSLGLSGSRSGSDMLQGIPELKGLLNPNSDTANFDPLKDIQDSLVSILGKPTGFGSRLPPMDSRFPMTGGAEGEQVSNMANLGLPWISPSGFPKLDSGLFPRGIMGTYDASGNIDVANVTTAFLAKVTDTTWQAIVTDAITSCAADVAAFNKSSIPASMILPTCKPDAKLFISCLSKEINLKCPDFNSAVSRCVRANTELGNCDAHKIALPPPSLSGDDGLARLALNLPPIDGSFPPPELLRDLKQQLSG
ncbi:hypothetical protein B566_EDAN009460 [Ephemera danica]|nr:hypothetical protein B566_EDAN009460 [Ephemera danica]